MRRAAASGIGKRVVVIVQSQGGGKDQGPGPAKDWKSYLRPVAGALLGLTGFGLYLYRDHPAVAALKQKLGIDSDSDSATSSQDRLIVRSLQDTLDIYSKSIGTALNEDPQLSLSKSIAKKLPNVLTKLGLNIEQLTAIESATTRYYMENKSVYEKLQEEMSSVELLENVRKYSVDPSRNELPIREETLEKLFIEKFKIEITYLQTVTSVLSLKQYDLLLSEIKASGTKTPLSEWSGLLNSAPLGLPLPTRRVIYVLNFKGDIYATQVLASLSTSSYPPAGLKIKERDYCYSPNRRSKSR